MELKAVEWRSGFRTIGFCLFLDTVTKKYNARFEVVTGFDEKVDIEHIRDIGTKMSYQEAKGFFPWIKQEEYK